jgi:hypothetical protein
MPMTDFNELIPEMRDWNNGKGVDVQTWVECEGNFRLAVGYSTLFWPRFTEFEGYVLREGFSVESLRGFEQQCQEGRKTIEAVMNHFHLDGIQYMGCEDINRDRLLYLGQILREIYQVKLAWQFPNKRFEVMFDDSFQDDLVNYQITFYQIS